jgi:hypothetical protein
MSTRNRDDDPLIAPGAAGTVGGQAVVPDYDLVPGRDDPNGPVPDDEETHDAALEDGGLLDGDSPEFDHSLRRRP